MTDDGPLADRVKELEFQLTHIQRIYDQLNDVVTEQAGRIDRLHVRIDRLESLASDLKRESGTAPDPLDEKPPHY